MTDLRPTSRCASSNSRRSSERGATVVEYVGLGAVSAMLVTAIAAALDSAVGEQFGSDVVAKLLEAIAG